MEADKTSQISAFLDCRSRADLRRLRRVISLPLITLACQHNRADLLQLLLEDDTSSTSNCEVVIVRCSVDQQYEGHDAVYYAIRSSNVELLRTLLGSVHPELSERLVSESYEELLLNNVLVSEEMQLFVQYKLIDLRFFSKSEEAPPATTSVNIQERIQLLVENIVDINKYTEVDSRFLYTAKFIAQNIHILKHQLKSTYNILPWEEMEFCLVSFVSAHIRRHELNIFYVAVLKKERLLKELDKFVSALQELKEYIGSTDIWKLSRPVVFDSEDAAAIRSRFPYLCADFKEVRDVSSLHTMKTYLDAALLANSATRLGQLTIKRALQITGEHLKNTLDSPKLSRAVSDLLLLSVPKETKEVLKKLRQSLSHPHREIEDCKLYSNIQNDIKKIASVITDITYFNKVDRIKRMLTTLITSDSIDEIQGIVNVFRNVYNLDVQETNLATQKFEDLIIDIIRDIMDQTPYEKKLFAEIKNVLHKTKSLFHLTSVDYAWLKSIVFLYFYYSHSTNTVDNTMREIKFRAKKALEYFPTHKNPSDCYLLANLLSKFYNSVYTRIKPEIAVEIKYAIGIIYYTASIDKGNINFIDEYGRQILLKKFNKNDNGGVKYNTKSANNNSEIIGTQLTLKLTDLGNLIGTNRMCGQLYEHISTLYKDKTANRLMVETLVLDIMSLLDGSRRAPNNVLYLDGDMPLLSGRCLRNHLAHRNALVDILPTDAWSAVLLNAVKLTESKDLLLKCKIGNILKQDIKQLRGRYERGLSILDKQMEMWKSLLDGNLENFTLLVAGGADIYSRKEDLSSTLHYAARGPNIETIKFLTKQKMISTEARDVDGQSALHVAAMFGRDVIVKFLVEEMGNAINQVDGDGNTPLHLASQNGHKKTVMTLLSLGDKTNVKNGAGDSPLRCAVIKNYLDVVKILLVKDATDDVDGIEGCTLLHAAAEFGNIETVKYLLLNEVDVNAKSNRGILPCHLAAMNGHLEVVNTLLEKGAHVNLRDFEGYTSLHLAVENNHKEIVKILLDKGAFVNNGLLAHNHTPLHTAAYNGYAIIVGLLLQHKANVNARSDDDLTPLHYAAVGGNADIVDLLLQNGALGDSEDVTGPTVLHVAAQHGCASVVETLIQWGINIQPQNTYQMTPLHLAAQEGHKQVVDILLAAGANVHSVNDKGSTALHLSAAKAHEAISEALIKKGAKVNCKNNENFTPLLEAATKSCNEKSIQVLLNYGAGVNEKDELYRTALHIASLTGDSSTVEALLQAKADVDAEDYDGATALHLAVSGNHKAAVELLLKYGSNVNHLDTSGSSALCSAAGNNNKDLLNILIAKGADVNVSGGKLLLSAITMGHRLVVDLLLKNRDIDINIKDQYGSNLLYAAAESGDGLIARALIKRGVKVSDCIKDRSPLLLGISFGHTEFVEVLLENGANVNPADLNLSPLHHAVLTNKPDIMERLLHWGAKSNIRDSKNRTPLELAVANAQMQNTLILLEQVGSRINDRGNDNWTLLHISARAGSLEVTKLLVDRGADQNARNRLGSKPIHIAAMEGYHNILAFFLELRMSIEDPGDGGLTLMHLAATRGRLSVAQYLIDKHVDINSTDLNGLKPIHYSAQQGHTDMVKLLLHSGAVYDATDNSGRTPSDLTKCRDIKKVFESIRELFKVVKRNDVLMVRTLIKDMAKYVDVKSSNNATLLHIASWRGFQEVCDILLKGKANPNAVGKGGNAPLHYASKYSHPGIVGSLLKNGAVYNLKADNGKSPLDFAEQKDIKSLLQRVAVCFKKVGTHDVKVIKDIAKIKDVEIIKVVMKARNTYRNTLVVFAMKCGFPNVDELKQVSQVNVSHILDEVLQMIMRERFTEAIDILKQLLNKRIEILEEDNPGTLDIQYKIAEVLCAQSQYFEAMPMFEEIYRKRVEAFGPHHPDSLETRASVARILHRLGRNEESWDIFQEVIPRQREALGEGHIQLMRTKVSAGDPLRALGKHEEALLMYMQVYKKHIKIFGARHHDTLCLQNNIAMVLQAQGKSHEAFAMFQTVYETRKIILPLNHSDTLRARRNMTIITSEHKPDEALQVFKEIIAIQKNVLGLNHKDTMYTQSLITLLNVHQNNLQDALKDHKAGLKARNATLGPNHAHFTELDRCLNNLDKHLKLTDIDVNYIPPCDFNLLKAAREGDRGEVCSLIENGSDVNTADDEGRTALHFAATVEVMKLLLDSGADPTAVSQKGNTPLHLATSRACEQMVLLLLQNVKISKPKAYRNFINAKTVGGGSTALHVAAKKGTADIVSCLLEHGACYNSRDRSDNRTPLQCSSSPFVTRLLHLTEELFERARRGDTVLPQGDEIHLVKVMNSTDTENRTPVQLALFHGHTGTARLLVEFLKTLH